MTGDDRYRRVLRWYPAAWRERYGDEMAALLEDTHPMADLPVREQAALAARGVMERLRAGRALGPASGREERIRGGALVVLWAWAVFVVAGSVFAKFSEHWAGATPTADRPLPTSAFQTVQAAAAVGGILVLAAAALAVPAFVRLVRGGRWREVRAPVLRAAMAVGVVVLGTVALAVWAHDLTSHDRNGGLALYGALFLVWAATTVAALAACTAAAAAVARHLDLSSGTLRIVGGVALVLTADMAAVLLGTTLWWASVARVAPGVLGNGMLGTSSVLAPLLVGAGVAMVAGLALASWGAVRVGRSLWAHTTP